MKEEKKRETRRKDESESEREGEKHIGEPYQRGGAAKGDEGGGARWETRTGEGERKDVKQSNDEMHFPPGSMPLSHPRAHSAFTRRETSNETLKTGGEEE